MSAIQIDERINLNEVMVLNEMQAKSRYNIGRNSLRNIANEAGAVVMIGRKYAYLREAMDDYFRSKAT